MKPIIAHFQREFWEYKSTILYLPLSLAAICVIGLLISVFTLNSANISYRSDNFSFSSTSSPQTLDFTTDLQPYHGDALSGLDDKNQGVPRGAAKHSKKKTWKFRSKMERLDTGFMSVFISISWLAASYYLLYCLYSDRKDKSILFWKSLPFSETQNLLVKFAFGAIAIPAVTLIIAWLTYLILFSSALLIGLGNSKLMAEIPLQLNGGNLFLTPLLMWLIGAIWAAPLFGYLLLVSAFAKKSPQLLLIAPIFGLALFERIVFASHHVLQVIGSYMPTKAITLITAQSSYSDVLASLLIDYGGQLLIGLIAAGLFVSAAIWLRNNHFEN